MTAKRVRTIIDMEKNTVTFINLALGGPGETYSGAGMPLNVEKWLKLHGLRDVMRHSLNREKACAELRSGYIPRMGPLPAQSKSSAGMLEVIEAIAIVQAREWAAEAQDIGEVPDMPALGRRAMELAMGLPGQKIARLRKLDAVKMELKKIRGEDTSLKAVLQPNAEAAE